MTMEAREVKRVKLYEQIVADIREQIVSEKLKPGEKIPSERELARLYGVSRLAVREALSALAAIGLIEVKHGVGCFVRQVERRLLPQDIALSSEEKDRAMDLLVFRRGFEPEAARLAALYASQEEIEEIARLQEAVRDNIMAGGTAVEEDFRFHMAVVRATHSPIFIRVAEALEQYWLESFKLCKKHTLGVPTRLPVLLEEHQIVLRYLFYRNPDGAYKAMKMHIENAIRKLET